MSHPVLISILALTIKHFGVITANYLEVENGYLKKPLAERNNVVNKGVWVRSNKNKENFDNGKLEDFIFRPNSLDVDNLIQGDTFGDFVSSYVERHRRNAKIANRKRGKRSVTNCNGNNCNTNNIIIDSKPLDQNIITKLKPTSVINDYPYEIAVLLDTTRKELERAQNISESIAKDQNRTKLIPLDEVKTNYSINIETIRKDDKTSRDAYKVSDGKNDSLMLKNVEIEYMTKLVKKNEYNTEDLNNSVSHKFDRDVFDKAHPVWKQNVPFPQTTSYKVLPKTDGNTKKNRPITEKGLVKVLSMLTKTFKKIMKQHDDIKEIHKKMHTMNKHFIMNMDTLTEKLKDFDIKYSNLLETNDRIKDLEVKLNAKELYFKNKENELSKNLFEFENQQKKFLTQQRQFYNIQKLMLAQNEKINAKQNIITKTQCEISHRQNNFARILKKAKQIYTDRYNDNSKIPSSLTSPNESDKKSEDIELVHSTTIIPQTTESIKINLFSIPSITRLENQDHLLLNERDEQPVDDLVYKYYFNNTFLDNLVRNKILSSFVAETDNSATYNAKNKRNDDISHLHTTILLPVKRARSLVEHLIGENLNRKRRWINHHSKRSRRKNRGKHTPELNLVDDKFSKLTWKSATDGQGTLNKPALNEVNPPNEGVKADDPFRSMARNFCNSIGQNTDTQSLEWCIEKALRRLQGIDTRLPITPVTEPNPKPLRERESVSEGTTTAESGSPTNINSTPTSAQTMESSTPTAGTTINSVQHSTTTPPVTTSPYQSTPSIPDWPNPSSSSLYSNMFFPDNDMLENNLKQYELKPDTEGTIYYDGSLHASEIIEKSEGFSDLLLDQLESNSRIEVDPATFTLQAKRRALVRKMNDDILNKMSKRPRGYSK